MKIAGFILFALALTLYVWTVRAIWQLVSETNNLGTGVRFSRWWWTPAWKVHRACKSIQSTTAADRYAILAYVGHGNISHAVHSLCDCELGGMARKVTERA